MTAAWTAVLIVGAATIAIKAAGPVLAGERQLPIGVSRVLDLLAPALLAALVATQAFATDESLVLDERGAGLLAGAAAVLLKAPLLVVILVAAATAAGLRAIS
jgi:branched-subunit amino acid transport protein